MRIIAGLALAAVVAGCGGLGGGSGFSGPFSGGGGNGLRGQAAEVDGVRFRSRLNTDRADRRAFVVTVGSAARNPSAAREAGRTRAAEYCLRTFGGTEIAWVDGPDDAPEEIRLGDRGGLVLSGRCLAR